jgi:lipoprotein-releasing system ATP-binding protein
MTFPGMTTSKTIVLQAKEITKRFEKPSPFQLLHGINITLTMGQSTAIIGKSGEGKTTLLHILASLDTPTSGTLSLLGKPVHEQDVTQLRNQHIGFVFQAFHLLQDISCMDNLLLPTAIARQSTGHSSEAYKRATLLLEKVGLKNKKHLLAAKLSGGEKQRLAIARAFMNNPCIIFADEPTGNLDHETAKGIQELLFSWVKEEGKTLLLVTHNSDLAKQCDQIFTLESGKLQ